MRGAILATLALAACGPKATGPDPQPGPQVTLVENRGAGGETVVTAPAMCARIFALADQRCPLTEGYELTRDECVEDLTRSLEARGKDARSANLAAGRCLLDHASCDDVTACMDALNPYADEQDGTPTEFRTCEDHETYAPVGVSAEAWANRKGAGVTRYRDHDSSKDAPIEVCGLPAQLTWLMDATCDDGSRPFQHRQQAHASRVANVGTGGACASIIDLYEVPCPEGTYAIYIDAYVCPLP